MIEGLLGYYLPEMRDIYDVRVFLNPPEELRRRWKVQRDCSRRGYTTDQVLAELDRREPDSEAFIRPAAPPRRHARVVHPADGGDDDDQTHLDAELTLRDGLPHPDLMPFVNGEPDGADARRARRRADPADPRPDRTRARRRDRGGDLGADALRDPPAGAAARRVHASAPSCTARSRSRSCSC